MSNPRILILTSPPAVAEPYAAAIAGGERGRAWSVEQSEWGPGAVERLAAAGGAPYCVVLADPGAMPGEEVLAKVQQLATADPNLQIVLAADPGRADWLLEQLEPTDRLVFVRRPPDPAEVRQLVRGLIAKWELARLARLPQSEVERLASELTADLQAEVRERRDAEERFRRQALHDPLTGLPNRAHILEQIRGCIARQQQDAGYRYAVLFLDLDNFKLVNDTLGHDVGDALLVAIAQRVSAAIRTLDTVGHFVEDTTARLGGDEFVILLDGLRRSADAVLVAERIAQRLLEPFEAAGHRVSVTASIGIAVAERPHERPEDALREADAAMYRAKGSGKARYATFDHRLHEESLARLRLENDLRRALDQGQFRLVYQPIVATDTGVLMGFEALIRWDHPERGTLSPSDFLAVAEETGQILPIGRWVLAEACRQLRQWSIQHPGRHELRMSINISRRQLLEPGLPAAIGRALSENGLEPRRLALDIAEHAIMQRPDEVAAAMHEIRALGVALHMDDFGTGFATLNCLSKVPVDAVKIDRSFIINMAASRPFATLLFGVLSLAQSLKIRVIAEGVETAEQLALLLALGCDCIQGYHISKSLTAREAESLLEDSLRWPRAA